MSACTVDDVLTALEGLAKGATQGEWYARQNVATLVVYSTEKNPGDRRPTCICALNTYLPSSQERARRNAPYLAACSPATVLALCAVARAAEDLRAMHCGPPNAVGNWDAALFALVDALAALTTLKVGG